MPKIAPQKLSIIIPTYNRKELIESCILSVIYQDYLIENPYEIIIVDDSSNDGTEETIRKLQNIFPHITYLNTGARGGANHARNIGIKASSGDHIFFHDSDDIWMPTKVTKHINALLNEKAEVVFSSFIRNSDAGPKKYPDFIGRGSRLISIEDIPIFLKRNPISTQCLSIKREALRKIGGFDETLPRFQDWELAIRIIKECSVYYIDSPLVIVNDTPGSISKNYSAGITARSLILEKHKDFFKNHNAYRRFLIDYKIRKILRPLKNHYCRASRESIKL